MYFSSLPSEKQIEAKLDEKINEIQDDFIKSLLRVDF